MSKIEEIKDKYLKDADLVGSKSRFGFFSIPPSATAGHNSFEDKKAIRDQNGRVKTQERNIFCGLTASGVLKKSYFKFEPSIYQGDPYVDPGKHERQLALLQSQKLKGKDIYKPLSLSKTPQVKAAYEYIGQKACIKTAKDYLDESGKVKIEERNAFTNSAFKIENEKIKKMKYMSDPYENYIKVQREEKNKSIKLRGEAPYKPSSPTKLDFNSSRQVFGVDDKCLAKKQKKQGEVKGIQHEGNFRPSCCKKFDTFSYPEYLPEGVIEKQKRKNRQQSLKQKQIFKHSPPNYKLKPCPSISLMKMNIMKTMR